MEYKRALKKAGATYEKCRKGKDRKRVKGDAAKKVKEEELADDEKDDGEEHEEEALYGWGF